MAQDQLGGIEPLKECGLHLGAVRRMFPMIGLAMTVLSKRHDGGKNKSGDGQGCDRVKWFPHSAYLGCHRYEVDPMAANCGSEHCQLMGPPQKPTLTRWQFLGILASVGITASAGYTLYDVAPWLNDDEYAGQNRRPWLKDVRGSVPQRELVRYATLAASGHNTQPWKFDLHENAIDLHPDFTRRLPVVDPVDRELWISLGCALENLIVAARASGLDTEIRYPESVDFIRIRLTPGTPRIDALFEAVALRQNTRSTFDGRMINPSDFERVQAVPLEPGIVLRFVSAPGDWNTVAEYVATGNISQFADRAFVAELMQWVRFNRREVLATLDGLHSRCSGEPEVPRWLGQMVLSGMRPEKQARTDVAKLRSSSGVVVVGSSTDDKIAWVRTGQVYERLALTLTSLNIKSAFLNQPMEVPDIRRQFSSALGMGLALPQLLVRFGYADGLPQSLRRPVEDVIISSGKE